MQSIFAALFIFIAFISAAQASDGDCNLLLQSRWESSLNDLAVLRIDLDLQRAAGASSSITQTLENAYALKFIEILAAKTAVLSDAQLEKRLKQKVIEVQHELSEQKKAFAEKVAIEKLRLARELSNVTAVTESYTPLPWALKRGFAFKNSSDEVVLAAIDRYNQRIDYAVLDLATQKFEIASTVFDNVESVHDAGPSRLYVETSTNLFDLDLQTKLAVSVARFKKNVGSRTSAALGNGQLVFSGGLSRDQGSVRDASRFDSSSAKLKKFPSLLFARTGHQLIPLLDGRTLVVGGTSHEGVLRKEIEIVDAAGKKSEKFGELHEARRNFTATVLSDGQVVLIGGAKTIEIIDVFTKNVYWDQELPEIRESHAATLLPDDRILISGGKGNGRVLNSILLFDPIGAFPKEIGKLKFPRSGHHQIMISENEVLVLGGEVIFESFCTTEKITIKVQK